MIGGKTDGGGENRNDILTETAVTLIEAQYDTSTLI